MKWLVDTDVLFAAINAAHEHHRDSRRWLDEAKPAGWGAGLETFLAVVRLLMNPVVMRGFPLDAAEALATVRAELGGSCPGRLVPGGPPDDAFLRKAGGHKQIMDFYLIQTACAHHALLATRDRGTAAAWPEHTFRLS